MCICTAVFTLSFKACGSSKHRNPLRHSHPNCFSLAVPHYQDYCNSLSSQSWINGVSLAALL
eukprot:3868290-Amphidinium_carterae.1